MVMPIARRVYAIASVVWAAALPGAAYAATRVHAAAPTHAFALLVYGIGTIVCHQRPDRSFHLWGARLPVCARCTGVYVGAAIVAAVAVVQAFRRGDDGAAGPTRGTIETTRARIVLAALPTAATLVFEWTTGIAPSNGVRFVAGLPLGVVVSWLLTSRVN